MKFWWNKSTKKWWTTSCQQRPQMKWHKSGRCTQVSLYLQYFSKPFQNCRGKMGLLKHICVKQFSSFDHISWRHYWWTLLNKWIEKNVFMLHTHTHISLTPSLSLALSLKLTIREKKLYSIEIAFKNIFSVSMRTGKNAMK